MGNYNKYLKKVSQSQKEKECTLKNKTRVNIIITNEHKLTKYILKPRVLTNLKITHITLQIHIRVQHEIESKTNYYLNGK